MKVVDYQVIEANSCNGLISRVVDKIADGWTPQGGVFVMLYEVEGYLGKAWLYSQAMVKVKSE